MPGDSCIVCGNSCIKDCRASFHRFPSDPACRSVWMQIFKLDETGEILQHSLLYRHFLGEMLQTSRKLAWESALLPQKRKTLPELSVLSPEMLQSSG